MEENIRTWSSVIVSSLQKLVSDFIIYLDDLFFAVIVIIIGWIVAMAIGRFVTEVLRRIKFDTLFEKGVWKKALEKAEWKIDPSGFVGALTKWVLFVYVLLAAIKILGFTAFSFLDQISLGFLPNLIASAAIFVIAVIAAEYVPKIIRAGAEGIEIKYGNFLEIIIRYAIWMFAIMAILSQMKIAEDMIQILFIGFVAFLTIAGGLAFGLGGKDFAAELLEDMKKKMKERE